MNENSRYKPEEFKFPPQKDFQIYWDTLGKTEFEMAASHIIKKAQEKGKWTPIKEWHPDYKVDLMVDKGFMQKTEEGYMLTDVALALILAKYPAKASS